MWNELLATFREIAVEHRGSCVVLTGAGGEFCAGADLTGGGTGGPGQHQLAQMRHISDVALALHRLPIPTIAKVRGVAVGAGCNMAIGCDVTVVSDNARFSEIFARRGLSIDFGGSWLLPRIVGMHRAKELALFADIIDARRGRTHRPRQPCRARCRARRSSSTGGRPGWQRGRRSPWR